MILYHAVTSFHILKFAIHKLIYHKNEDAVLLIPDFMIRVPEGIGNGENGIFSRVVVFDWETSVFDEIKPALDMVDSFMHREFADFPNDFSEINVCRAAYMFGIYLCKHHVPFQWFEEADGRYTDPCPIINDDERIYPARYKAASDLGLYTGDNQCVTKRFISYESQQGDSYKEKTEDFNVINCLKDFDKNERFLLMKLFGVFGQLDIRSRSALILTGHYVNLKQVTYEEQALMYKLMTDYFLDGYNIYIKPHPSDLMPYPSLIKNCRMLSGDYPSELLTLVCNNRFDVIASVSSTGMHNLKEIGKKAVTLGSSYISEFTSNHKYYFCAELLKLFPKYNCISAGLDEERLAYMLEVNGVDRKPFFCNDICDLNAACDTIYLLGSSEGTAAEKMQHIFDKSSNCVFVFINNMDYLRIFGERFAIVKKIEIYPGIQSESSIIYSYEPICIFSKSEGIRKEIQNMNYIKTLLNADITAQVRADDDKDLRISVLEGMLEAAEAELLRRNKENPEIEQKSLNEFKGNM